VKGVAELLSARWSFAVSPFWIPAFAGMTGGEGGMTGGEGVLEILVKSGTFTAPVFAWNL
jgi:hypothetical protein